MLRNNIDDSGHISLIIDSNWKLFYIRVISYYENCAT